MKNMKNSAFKQAQREADKSRTSGQVTRLMGTKAVPGIEIEPRTRTLALKVSKHQKVQGANV